MIDKCVCRLCIKPGHIFRECPELKCFKCGGGGHYARDCEGLMGLEKERVEGQEDGERGDHVTLRWRCRLSLSLCSLCHILCDHVSKI